VFGKDPEGEREVYWVEEAAAAIQSATLFVVWFI
jgi:hypothetical protein